MVLLTTAITFLATIAVCVSLLFAFSTGDSRIAERLSRIWNPGAERKESNFRERQEERVEKALARVGNLLPPSGKTISQGQKLLVRAGFRRPEVVFAFRGTQLILPVAAAAALYVTGAYHTGFPFLPAFLVLTAYMLPGILLNLKIRRRQRRLQLALPDALDLMVICVEAGLGLDQTILRVSQELHISHPEMSEELQLVNTEMRVGKARLDALRALAGRTGVEDIKALVAMLVQTDRFGTSVAQSLRTHSDDLRTKRRQRAEEAAAKTTVKMVPPLVFCIFPALMVVILGPAVITLVRQLMPAIRH